jgi:hypothetical protein
MVQPTLKRFLCLGNKTPRIADRLRPRHPFDTICCHMKRKRICPRCTGCKHNRRRAKCRLCSPHMFCKHNRVRYECSVCRGCKHGKRAGSCVECTTVTYRLEKANWYCVVCTVKRLSEARRATGVTVCAACDSAVPVRREVVVRKLLCQLFPLICHVPFPEPSAVDNVHLNTCGAGSQRRPDMCWVLDNRVVHLEIDENSHRSNEVSCELAKLDETNFGRAGPMLPTVVIRFNPDRVLGYPSLTWRIAYLSRCLSKALWAQLPLCPLRANVIYLYYSKTGLEKHQAAALKHTTSLKVLLARELFH